MKLYFRIRKAGAFVYRMEVENRQRRLELVQIATITQGGDVRPQKGQDIAPAEMDEILAWQAAREAEIAAREAGEARLLIEQINLAAAWVQQKSTDAEIAALSDPLLMAMHDLRQVIVRRLSRIGGDPEGEAE